MRITSQAVWAPQTSVLMSGLVPLGPASGPEVEGWGLTLKAMGLTSTAPKASPEWTQALSSLL